MDSPVHSERPRAPRAEPTSASARAHGIPDIEMQMAMRAVMAGMLGRVRDVHIGRYVVRRRLGHGGCGLVLLADDPELGREVAIKVVLPTRDRDERGTAWQKALQREAQALAKLRHPNVVEVYDAGTTTYGHDARARHSGEGQLGVFLVMERLRGVTLRQWLDRGPRPWREIIAVFEQAALGLVAAHAAGIVHRDFKPDNVLITDDDRVVLIDFGLADEAQEIALELADATGELVDGRSDDGGDDDDAGSGSHTRASRIVGTPIYMAPEQHDGHVAGPAADQYAWCVSLFAALFGEPPFAAAGLAELSRRKHAAIVPRRKGPVPRAVQAVLRRGLAARPEQRHADLATLLDAMRRACAPRRPVQAASLLAAATVPLALWLGHAPTQHPCDAAPADVQTVWSAPQQVQLTTALASLLDPNAKRLAERVAVRIEANTRRWSAARAEACNAEPSPRLDAQLACLDRELAQTEGVIGSLTALELDELGRAGALLDALPDPEGCLALDADPRPAAQRSELAELWRGTDALGVEVSATGTIDDPSWVEQAMTRADALGDDRLVSMLAWRRSQVARAAGRFEEAVQFMRTAVFRSTAAGELDRALEMMPILVLAVGSDLRDRAEAERLLAHARVMTEQVADPRQALATLDATYAYILIEHSELDGAKAMYDRAWAVFETLPPSEEAARCLMSLAGWEAEHGDDTKVPAMLERAAAILDDVALPTDLSFATIAFIEAGMADDRGDFEAAAEGFRGVVGRIRRRLHGHPFLAVGLDAAARAEAKLGHFDEATSLAVEARDLVMSTQGPSHPDRIRYELLIAHVAWLGMHFDAAAAAADRAIAALADAPDAMADFGVGAQHLAGWTHLASGDLRGAAVHLAACRSLPGEGDSNVDLPRSLRRLEAMIARGEGRLEAARAALTRPIESPIDVTVHDPALERMLDAMVDTAIDGTAAADDGVTLRADRALYRTAFAAAIAAAARAPATALANAAP